MTGTIVPGDRRGRTLGFPTANVQLDGTFALPTAGIYAGWVCLRAQPDAHAAVVHIGPRPTFHDDSFVVELHLLRFVDKDLYGQRLAFLLLKKIRDVIQFPSKKLLVDAISNDCISASLILKGSEPHIFSWT